MAREMNKLSARAVATLSEPGRHSDGGGLYLNIGPGAARRWVFLFRWQGKLKEMGLGSASAVSLAKARQLAADARATIAEGRNPIEEKRKSESTVPTFGEAADAYIEAMAPTFRSDKHLAQWRMTLTQYAAPIRAKLVSEIETPDVLAVLAPLWKSRPETASRLRGRIERVLDASRAKGHRTGENPARWRGHLDHLLPARQKLTRGHHAALPFGEVPAFLVRLREREGVAPLALEFCIITAARSGEVREATWGEIDRAAKVWTVPAARMKAGREHRVPLAPRALAILDVAAKLRQSDDAGALVFPGAKRGKPLSGMSFDMLLRRMEAGEITTHGFRSAFRDWAGEATSFPREVAEAALAHVVGDQTERAYRRGDALEKRRKLMAAWASFCAADAGGNVVPLRQA